MQTTRDSVAAPVSTGQQQDARRTGPEPLADGRVAVSDPCFGASCTFVYNLATSKTLHVSTHEQRRGDPGSRQHRGREVPAVSRHKSGAPADAVLVPMR